jgi:hypothetical protein
LFDVPLQEKADGVKNCNNMGDIMPVMKSIKEFINTFSDMITILTFFGVGTGVILLNTATLNRYSTLIIFTLLMVLALLFIKFRKYRFVKLNSFSNKLNVGFDTLNLDYVESKFEDFLPTTASLSRYFNVFVKEMRLWDSEAVFTDFSLSVSVQGCIPSYSLSFSAFSKIKQAEISMDYVGDRDGLEGTPFKKIRSVSKEDEPSQRRAKPFFKLYPKWREIASRAYAPIEHRKKEYLSITVSDGYFINNPDCMDIDLSYHWDDQDFKIVLKVDPKMAKKPEKIKVEFEYD